jgi:hypothetical protein
MALLLDRKRTEMEKGVKIADVDMLHVERTRKIPRTLQRDSL